MPEPCLSVAFCFFPPASLTRAPPLPRPAPAQVRRQTGVPLLQGGIPALFAGAGPSAAFRVLHGALYMPLYASIKHALRDGAGLPAAAAVTGAAAGATVVTALVEIPIEAVMLRLKSGTGASFGRVLAAALAAPGGAGALWAGAAPYVLRHVMFEAAEFVVYEHLRERTLSRRALNAASASGAHASSSHAPSSHDSHGAHGAGLDSRTAALLAATAGAAATVASHPMDVVRVATSMSHAGASGAAGALSARAAAAHILRTAGPAGFARGLLPRLATTVPGSVIFFTVYELARNRIAAAEADAAAAAAEKRAAVAVPLRVPAAVVAAAAAVAS